MERDPFVGLDDYSLVPFLFSISSSFILFLMETLELSECIAQIGLVTLLQTCRTILTGSAK